MIKKIMNPQLNSCWLGKHQHAIFLGLHYLHRDWGVCARQAAWRGGEPPICHRQRMLSPQMEKLCASPHGQLLQAFSQLILTKLPVSKVWWLVPILQKEELNGGI